MCCLLNSGIGAFVITPAALITFNEGNSSSNPGSLLIHFPYCPGHVTPRLGTFQWSSLGSEPLALLAGFSPFPPSHPSARSHATPFALCRRYLSLDPSSHRPFPLFSRTPSYFTQLTPLHPSRLSLNVTP